MTPELEPREPRVGKAARAGGVSDRSGTVASLAHGLSILSLYCEGAQVIGIGEMAQRLGLHRSTTSRLAATLCASAYLERADTAGRYRLGPRVLELGVLASQGRNLRAIAVEELSGLVERYGETAHLGMLDGREARMVAVVDGWHSVRHHSAIGKLSPAHCSSLGKALLVGLSPETLRELYPDEGALVRPTEKSIHSFQELEHELALTRERGYSLDDEELELGLRCVGAPVIDAFGTLVAAVSVSGPSARVHGRVVDELAREVRAAAERISRRIGGQVAPDGHHAEGTGLTSRKTRDVRP